MAGSDIWKWHQIDDAIKPLFAAFVPRKKFSDCDNISLPFLSKTDGY